MVSKFWKLQFSSFRLASVRAESLGAPATTVMTRRPSRFAVATRQYPADSVWPVFRPSTVGSAHSRSEENTSELQSIMRISYAVFCLKKQKKHNQSNTTD